MKKYNTECVVLKSINYKDYDKLITFFSRDRGKFTALAKGVRKISSRRSGHLDSINHVIAGISESDKGFKILTEIKTLNSFKSVKKSLKSCEYGYYMAELVHRSIDDGQSVDGVFDVFVKYLNFLDLKSGTSVPDPVYTLSKFEYLFMGFLGYKITVDKCANCLKTYNSDGLDWEKTGFSYELGGLVCKNCLSSGFNVSQKLASVLNSLSIKNFDERGFADNLLDLDMLMREYIEDKLGERIKTHRIFASSRGTQSR